MKRKLGFAIGAFAALGVAWMSACGGDDSSSTTPDASSDGAGDGASDASSTGDTSSTDGGSGSDGTIPFGDGGLLVTPSPLTSEDTPAKLLRQSDGKYIAVCGNQDQYGVVMARVSSNGTLDSTFGQGGYVWGQNTQARSAALQSDGKIVIAGYDGIARYDDHGALDTSFKPPVGIGQAGVVNVEAVTLQADGKILAAGNVGGNFRVHRLLTGGPVDTAFNTTGIVTVSFGPYANAVSVAQDPSTGKIVAAGYAGSQLAVAVWNSDGTPDTGFAGTGHLTGSGTFTSSQAAAVAFQSDHKILVAGYGSGDGGTGGVVVRYDTAGALDGTFGTGGAFHGGSGFASMTVRPSSGAIVLTSAAGYVQLTSSGALDGTFGTSGVASFAALPQAGAVGVGGVTFDADGSITGLGALAPGGDNQPKVLARYSASGSLDTTFGAGGEAVITFHARRDEARAIVAEPSGSLVVGGQSSGYGMLTRYLPSGALDPSFADGGVLVGGETIYSLARNDAGTIYTARDFGTDAITPSGARDPSFAVDGGPSYLRLPSGDWYTPRSVALDGQGRVLLGGYGGGSRPEHVGVLRFQANGTPDSSFGTNGAYEGAKNDERIFAMAIDKNQNVVVTGFSGVGSGPSQKIVIVRLLGTNGALDASFVGDSGGDSGSGNGIVYASTGTARETGRAIAIQPDGKILVLANTNGEFYDTYDTGKTAVLRFGTDGKLDTSFGTGGMVTSISNFFARGMELRPDGSILLGGNASTTNSYGMGVMRLTSSGAVDTTFGSGGVYFAGAPSQTDGWAVATSSSGVPWVAGFITESPTANDFALTRTP